MSDTTERLLGDLNAIRDDLAEKADALAALDDLRTCGFPDPATDEECGANGVIFLVQETIPLAEYDAVTRDLSMYVCPLHVGAAMGTPIGDGTGQWIVTLVQDTP